MAACAGLELGVPVPFGLWAELLRDLEPQLEPPPASATWPSDLAVWRPP